MARSKSGTRVTITSIAEKLGVSVATVSYVMNGKTQENGISDATAERVRAAAQKMGYIPNDLARSLRLRQTGSIGVIFSDLQQGWADRTMKGMLSVLDPEDYVAYLSVHFWDAPRERRELQSMMKRRMDAIITVPLAENADEYNAIARQGVPLIFLSDELTACPAASSCMWDASEAVRECVRHLVAGGRRRIGFSGVDYGTPGIQVRLEAYRQALAECGLEASPEWICLDDLAAIPTSPETPLPFGSALRKLLFSPKKKQPDAFLAMNDAVATTTLEVLREAGRRVPEDCAVIGMGDLVLAPLLGLSSAREPLEEVGQTTARLALKLIRSERASALHEMVPGSEIMARMTSAPAPRRSRG